jgi:hypothetical protein
VVVPGKADRRISPKAKALRQANQQAKQLYFH